MIFNVFCFAISFIFLYYTTFLCYVLLGFVFVSIFVCEEISFWKMMKRTLKRIWGDVSFVLLLPSILFICLILYFALFLHWTFALLERSVSELFSGENYLYRKAKKLCLGNQDKTKGLN